MAVNSYHSKIEVISVMLNYEDLASNSELISHLANAPLYSGSFFVPQNVCLLFLEDSVRCIGN